MPLHPPHPLSSSRLQVTHGPRSAELRLLELIDRWMEEVRSSPSRLLCPFLIVVPSKSLRDHLRRRLICHRGAGVVGVEIRTARSLARSILEKAGRNPREWPALAVLTLKRHAQKNSEIRDAFGSFEDPHGALLASVRDLSDAGFLPHQTEALEELIIQSELSPTQKKRALWVVRAARALEESIANLLPSPKDVPSAHHEFSTAAILLSPPGEQRDLGPEPVVLYGFSDATGCMGDFLETLTRVHGAIYFEDHPPNPVLREGRQGEAPFMERLPERLRPYTQSAKPQVSPRTAAAELHLLAARNVYAEAKAVAGRIREALQQAKGRLSPEDVGVVVRDLEPYAAALGRELTRQSIPFSSPGDEGPRDPHSRHLTAFGLLLQKRLEAPSERWLDALQLPQEDAEPPEPVSAQVELFAPKPAPTNLRHLLLTALRSRGLVRVRHLVGTTLESLDLEDAEASLPLPVREGFSIHETQARPHSPVVKRRRISGKWLGWALERAQLLSFQKDVKGDEAETPQQDLSPTLTFRQGLDRLCRIARKALGWSAARIAHMRHTIDGLLPLSMEIPWEDLLSIVSHQLTQPSRLPLGGEGGGVAILNVTQARWRTFERLFIMGMNRGLFPRPITNDPLLTEKARRVLRDLLPQIPLKGTGYEEERFLFASLLSASPRVDLSYSLESLEGTPLSPSTLLDAVRLGRSLPLEVEDEAGTPGAAKPPASTAYELSIQEAQRGGTKTLAPLMGLAWRELGATFPEVSPPEAPERLANHRVKHLNERDAPPAKGGVVCLGPNFGFVGPATLSTDPRFSRLFVTTLEGVARCPWQSFVRRVLRVEPPRDDLDALATLDATHIGSTVHRFLELVVQKSTALLEGPREAQPQRKLAALEKGSSHPREPRDIPWPPPEIEARLLEQAATETLQKEAIPHPELASLLTTLCRPLLRQARELEWVGGQLRACLGAELTGRHTWKPRDPESQQGQAPKNLPLQGVEISRRDLYFRADRVDQGRDGRLAFTDYKTGKPPTTSGNEAKYLQEVEQGRLLQGVVYAKSQAPLGRGRYVYLDPEKCPLEHAAFVMDPAGPAWDALETAFQETCETLMASWQGGLFLPRLVQPLKLNKEGEPCSYCEVKEACLYGDSSSKRRLVLWAKAMERRIHGSTDDEPPAPSLSPLEASLWRLWQLACPPNKRQRKEKKTAQKSSGRQGSVRSKTQREDES